MAFFTKHYKKELKAAAERAQRQDGMTMSVTDKQQQEKAIESLVAKSQCLPESDLVFLVDMLLEICKLMMVGDKYAIILGCHLMPTAFA